MNVKTYMSADALFCSLGAALFQTHELGNLKLVAYISRPMTATEWDYAPIDKVALAFTCVRVTV